MSQATNRKQTALITGASSGIGRELSKLMAADGYDLVLVARSQAKLDELAAEMQTQHDVRCTTIPADLSRPDAPGAVVERLGTDGLEVDVLVNCAGYGLFGAFAETSWEAELQMIQVNITSLVELTKRLLPAMVARGRGRILNVASTAAFQPGPLMAVYYATKSFVLSFSEAIGNELEGTGVTVTALCPGPTRSGFQSMANMEASRLVRGKALPGADEVAAAGYRAMNRGKRVFIPGAKNRMLAWSVRLMPRNMVTATVRRTQAAT